MRNEERARTFNNIFMKEMRKMSCPAADSRTLSTSMINRMLSFYMKPLTRNGMRKNQPKSMNISTKKKLKY